MRRFLPPLGTILAIGADGKKAERFTLRPRPDGQLRVDIAKDNRPLKAGRYILAVDPGMLFHRRMAALPRSRRALLAMAEDLFPFPLDETRFAATETRDGVRCWACREETWEKIIGDLPAPGAVIIAPADPDALEEALSARLRSSVSDLLPHPALMVPPAPVVTGVLAIGCLALAIALVDRWDTARTDQIASLQAEVLRLEESTAGIRAQRQALIRMNAGLSALAEMTGHPAAELPATLGRVFSALPSGSHIDDIGFNDGRLTISGLGNAADQWGASLGAAPQDIEIADRPKTDRFTIRLKVGNGAPPASPSVTKD
jgi:hypothetical protein